MNTNEEALQPVDFDVVIIGGGPVGCGLAIELAQRGIKCAVVENYSTPQRVPKGQNLTQRTMEHFHFWGIEKALREAVTIPLEHGNKGCVAYGTLTSDYHYGWLERGKVQDYYYARNERLPQYQTEGVLRQRVSEFDSITVFYDWRGEQVSQEADAATVQIVERNGTGKKSLRARYVVGCDGAKSVTREQSGITQARAEHDKLMCLLVFKSADLQPLLEEKHQKGTTFYSVMVPEFKGYWVFFGRVDLKDEWFFHAPVPMGTTTDNFDFAQFLRESVGKDIDIDLSHVGLWDLRVCITDNYRNGRVFVAGDAAHSHPPYGGFGINTGFEDARNLGWKLAEVLKGRCDEKLLDTYSEERQPVFASTAHDFIEMSIKNDAQFLAEHDLEKNRHAFEQAWAARTSGGQKEVFNFEPHYEGSSIVFGPVGATSGAQGSHVFTARAGHHLAPLTLSNGKSSYDALGSGFTLFAFDVDPADLQSFEDAAKEQSMTLHIVTDILSDDTKKYQARYLLVRPDQFVAWASDTAPTNARDVLKKVIAG